MYDNYYVDVDIFKRRNHIFYLMGEKDQNWFVLASYSVKTDRLILKNASDFIPSNVVLKQFIFKAKTKYNEKE